MLWEDNMIDLLDGILQAAPDLASRRRVEACPPRLAGDQRRNGRAPIGRLTLTIGGITDD